METSGLCGNSFGASDVIPLSHALLLTQLNGFHLTFDHARRPTAPTLRFKKNKWVRHPP
jgi:hypothetical protein